MKRSGRVAGVTVMQLLLTATLLGITTDLLVLARSPQTLNLEEGTDAVRGLRIAAGIFAPLVLISLASVYGLWKNKLGDGGWAF